MKYYASNKSIMCSVVLGQCDPAMHARQQMTKDWETNKIPAPHPQISTGGMHQCAGEQLLRYWYACSGSQVLKSPKGDQFSNKHEIRFKSLLFLAVLVQGACSLGT